MNDSLASQLAVRIQTEGSSISDLQNLRKEFDALAKSSVIGSENFKTYSAATVDVKNRIHDATQSILSDDALMKQSYFSTGEAIRGLKADQLGLTETIKQSRTEHRTYMYAVTEGTHALEGLTGKNNEMAKSITGAAQSVMGMKFGLEMLGVGGMMGFAIAGVAALVSMMIELDSKSKASVEDMAELGKKARELKLLTGEITPQQNLDQQKNNLYWEQKTADDLKKAREARDEEIKSHLAGRGLAAFTPTSMSEDEVKAATAAVNLKIIIHNLEIQITEEKKKQAKIDSDAADEAGVAKMNAFSQFSNDAQRSGIGNLSIPSGGGRGTTMRQRLLSTQSASRFGDDRGLTVDRWHATDTDLMMSATKDANEQMKEFTTYAGPLVSGFNSVGSAIQTNIVDKLGKSNSLLQTFDKGLLSSAASLASNLATTVLIAGIGSAIPGVGAFSTIFSKLMHFDQGGTITEPVVGMGLQSGRPYSFAEKGPEYVVNPNTMNPASGGIVHHVVELTGGVGHDQIYLSSKIGEKRFLLGTGA